MQRTQVAARAAIADIEARGQAGAARRRHRPLRAGGRRRSRDPADRSVGPRRARSTPPTDDDGLAPRVRRGSTELDPAAAARMEPGNRRRIVRALEVIELTGRPFSSFGPASTSTRRPRSRSRCSASRSTRPRSPRASQRASTAMRAAGLVDEVARRFGRAAAVAHGARGDRLPRGARAPRGRDPDARRRVRRRGAAHAAVRAAPARVVRPRSARPVDRRRAAGRRARRRRSLRVWRDAVPLRRGGLVSDLLLSKLHATGNDFLVQLELDADRARARRGRRLRAVRPSPRHRRRRAHHDRARARRRRLHDDARERRRRARRDERQRRALPRVGRRPRRPAPRRRARRRHRGGRRHVTRRARRRGATSSRPTSTWARSRSTRPAFRSTRASPFDLEVDGRRHDVSRRRGRRRQPALRAARRRSRDGSGRPSTARASSTTRASRAASTSSSSRSPGRDRLTMRVWERGAGETQSCGTGACASAAVAHRRGLVGDHVRVDVLGGSLAVALGDDRAARRSGRARVRRRDAARTAARVIGATHRMTPPRAQAGRQRRRLTATEVDLERLRQRALLVSAGAGVRRPKTPRRRSTSSRCSPTPRARIRSSRCCNGGARPIRATYVGKGKADELRELVDALDIDVVIVDDELTPSQQRNLEDAVQGRRRRPRRVDPRHLRPARDEPGRRGAGRARAAALPVAAAARPGHAAQPAGWWHRHPRSG